MQVGTGILGIDVLADIRDVSADFAHWEWSWGHAGQTILDAVGIVPLIGAVKYTDEAGSLLKPVFKYGDELAIAGGGTIKQTEEVAEHITRITKENILDQVDDISKSGTSTGKYQVGTYQDIKGVDGLDAHHVGQKAVMKNLVENYDPKTAPAINVPKVGHTISGPNGIVSRNTKGIDNARQLLARDLFELKRVYPDIPNSLYRELIDMNMKMYPEMRK